MTDLRKAAEMAFNFLGRVRHWEEGSPDLHTVKVQLRAALAEPEQEPVGYVTSPITWKSAQHHSEQIRKITQKPQPMYDFVYPIYHHPATPLSEEQIHNADPAPHIMSDAHRIEFARAIEQAHGIGGKK